MEEFEVSRRLLLNRGVRMKIKETERWPFFIESRVHYQVVFSSSPFFFQTVQICKNYVTFHDEAAG